MWQRKELYVLNTKRYVWGKSNTTITEYHFIFSRMVVAESGYGYDKKKQNRAKQRQNPRGKPGSVCFPTDTGRQIHLLAGHLPKTQGQIYTGVAYQDNIECSFEA